MQEEWRGFTSGVWEQEINTRDFIQKNFSFYEGDESFLTGPTAATEALWQQVRIVPKRTRGRRGTGHGHRGNFYDYIAWPGLFR